MLFEGTPRLIKEQVAAFFEIDPRTVERCLEQNADELRQNGYEVILGLGTDGRVWKTSRKSAVKVFERQSNYVRERNCYPEGVSYQSTGLFA